MAVVPMRARTLPNQGVLLEKLFVSVVAPGRNVGTLAVNTLAALVLTPKY
jgi:hypothetical protein